MVALVGRRKAGSIAGILCRGGMLQGLSSPGCRSGAEAEVWAAVVEERGWVREGKGNVRARRVSEEE